MRRLSSSILCTNHFLTSVPGSRNDKKMYSLGPIWWTHFKSPCPNYCYVQYKWSGLQQIWEEGCWRNFICLQVAFFNHKSLRTFVNKCTLIQIIQNSSLPIQICLWQVNLRWKATSIICKNMCWPSLILVVIDVHIIWEDQKSFLNTVPSELNYCWTCIFQTQKLHNKLKIFLLFGDN